MITSAASADCRIRPPEYNLPFKHNGVDDEPESNVQRAAAKGSSKEMVQNKERRAPGLLK